MSTKTKVDSKTPVLKGKDAEDKILQYVKRMNRPFGAVDVAANLKGAVPKTATQKILVSLAERGELTQKLYGKTTFFVANQSLLESVPADEIGGYERELKALEEETKVLNGEVKTASSELAKIKAAPTDKELKARIAEAREAIGRTEARLAPLRDGAPLISEEERTQANVEWMKWRTEWVRRRKVFNTFWQLATDALLPQDSAALAEDLGIEMDSPEHAMLERNALCVAQKLSNPLKRKRL